MTNVSTRGLPSIATCARRGFIAGSVYAIYVSGLQLFLGGAAFEDIGVGLEVLIPGYLLGGVGAGMLYGVLAPLTRWTAGLVFVGALVALFCFTGAAIVLPNADLTDRTTWVVIGIAALLIGGPGALLVIDPPGHAQTRARNCR